PVVDVDLLGLVHKKRAIPFEPQEVPEHLQKPLEHMSDAELKELCKFHADELARAQDTRPKKDTNNTFAVGVVETTVHGPNGEPTTERKLVATSNMNEDVSVHGDAKSHMQENGIEDRTHGEPPHLTTQTTKDADGKPQRQTM